MKPIPQLTKAKIDKLDYSKILKICFRENYQHSEKLPTQWDQVFANHDLI
jgi:hypothetical protein